MDGWSRSDVPPERPRPRQRPETIPRLSGPLFFCAGPDPRVLRPRPSPGSSDTADTLARPSQHVSRENSSVKWALGPEVLWCVSAFRLAVGGDGERSSSVLRGLRPSRALSPVPSEEPLRSPRPRCFWWARSLRGREVKGSAAVPPGWGQRVVAPSGRSSLTRAAWVWEPPPA